MTPSHMQSNSSVLPRATTQEPIAIIGLGCRLPGGADDWRRYWAMLEGGVDAITETPGDRWNLRKYYVPNATVPGKTQSKWGGYVQGLDRFDPQLFGISPREAASMDPQQRLLLESAYRAIEDAGQRADLLAGQPVAVFVGISSFDYAVAGLSFQDRGVIDAYSNTGGSSSIAANRISYCFDLRGPSVAVDTACSSSLVAVHMACESIWRGQANMALAGGVNALILPDFYVAFSQLGVMSPDGRCKTFDARANGYVRGEGAGMVLLKPLRSALRDRDPIYAVIRSTALNQDGRTPGMTVPSQSAQEALIRQACENAAVAPGELQYVEAHGTGTPVGDPIEATAIGAVVGAGRDQDNRCWVGSVKTNIGHLEAGAGVASLIKVALALHHRSIPRNLHFREANPAIDLPRLGLRVPTQTEPWSSPASRLAGINGFGYGGANAHLILEQAPTAAAQVFSTAPSRSLASNRTPSPEDGPAPPVLLPLSARSHSGVQLAAGRLAAWLAGDGQQYHLAEVAGYLAHRRSHFDCRATVCASDTSAMIDQLQTLASSQSSELYGPLSAAQQSLGPAFVCCGQGPQWWAMGRGLMKHSPVFRSMLKRCDSEFAKYGDWSLWEELSQSEGQSRMQQTSIAQPSIFAIQVSLAALWESWGIKPAIVVGHSVGEIAAAYLSGALGWEDACCVAFHRGRTMDLASSQGAMVAAGLSPDQVPAWIEGFEDQVSLAAINGPTSVTISGAAEAIAQLVARLEASQVFCRQLAVEYAFHSPQMEPVRAELLRSLAHLQPQPTHTPWISTVTGQLIEGASADAEYWWRNVRQSVRFAEAMYSLAEAGYGLVVELGPHPVLAYAINECFQNQGRSVRTVASLNRQQSDLSCMSKSLGTLYAAGLEIDWSGFYNRPSRVVPVPTYAFECQRLWNESLESLATRHAQPVHPLLGEQADRPRITWQQRIDLKLQDYLVDHRVRESIVYPAAAIVETAVAAACALDDAYQPRGGVRLQRLRLHHPMLLAEDQPQWVETQWDAERRQLTLASRGCRAAAVGESPNWSPLATVELSRQPANPGQAAREGVRLQAARQRCTHAFSQQQLYAYCSRLGLQYGPRFQCVVGGQQCPGEAVAEIAIPSLLDVATYRLHPAVLDACFHVMIAADRCFDHSLDGLYLPAEIRELTLFDPDGLRSVDAVRGAEPRLIVHARVLRKTSKRMWCDLEIYTSEGQPLLAIRGFESQRVASSAALETTEDLIYGYRWQPSERPLDVEPAIESPQVETEGRWLVFMDEGHVGQELCQRLRNRGDQVLEIYQANSHVPHSPARQFQQLNPESRDEFVALLSRLPTGSVAGVVYLWGLDVPANDQLAPDTLRRSTQLTTLAPLYLIQAWEQAEELGESRLTLVTAGAQPDDDEDTPDCDVAQAPLIGLGRVIISEYQRLRGRLVDLPTGIATGDIDHLLAELLLEDEEDEIRWRDGQRWVRRFQPRKGKPLCQQAARALPVRLRLGAAAGVEELRYQTEATRTLASGQVEIEVIAAGLNFSDVMKALDLYPGLSDAEVDLGAECCGRISRVAPGSRWRVGDEVIAVAPGAFASHVVVDEALVAHKPANLSAEEAAAIPIAFLTAQYALFECARLTGGDSILIHAASGGVGLAAIQLAQAAGLQVLATAGTEDKRRFVRRLGVEQVMDSRTLEFGQQTLAATGGEGVQAVLNSLPGEAIATGLSVLKTGGRFLEIGKRDIYNDAALGLYPFRNNLALFAIDLDQLFKQQPRRMGQLLEQLIPRFESGELRPLPTEVFSANDTSAAFRLMQQGKHIGKVVVRFDERPQRVVAGSFDSVQLHPDRSYWIAGGLGGFGLEIARWMVARGARQLVLSGRSQRLSPGAERAVEQLREQGAAVAVVPADITQPADVRRVLETIDRELPPLAGIVHAAMVLEDKLLVDLDRATLEQVLWPKVLGGWNLHQQTRDRRLDLFVLFSSLSSVFGHAGQANYSAANALLDSLAHYRRSQGQAGLAINWGHLGEVGYLAERQQLGQRLERQGVLSFSIQQALDCLEYAIQTRAVQLSVLRMDWSVWRGLGITGRVSPRFAHLLRHADAAADGATEQASPQALRSATPARRQQLIGGLLRNKISGLLGMAAEQVRDDRAPLEMGLDSLMAVELRNWIESRLEISLPISALMRSQSLTELIACISDALASTVSAESSSAAVTSANGQERRSSTDGAVASDRSEVGGQPEGDEEITGARAAELLERIDELDDVQVSRLLSQVLKQRET